MLDLILTTFIDHYYNGDQSCTINEVARHITNHLNENDNDPDELIDYDNKLGDNSDKIRRLLRLINQLSKDKSELDRIAVVDYQPLVPSWLTRMENDLIITEDMIDTPSNIKWYQPPLINIADKLANMN